MVERTRVFVLVLGIKLLIALRVTHALTVGETIAVGVGGVSKGHAFHCVSIVSVGVVEVHALILSCFLLTHHLRFGVFGVFGVARFAFCLDACLTELAHVQLL